MVFKEHVLCNSFGTVKHSLCVTLFWRGYILDILYTAFNSPSLIFALQRSGTDSPSLEFTHHPISLHKPLYKIKLAKF